MCLNKMKMFVGILQENIYSYELNFNAQNGRKEELLAWHNGKDYKRLAIFLVF